MGSPHNRRGLGLDTLPKGKDNSRKSMAEQLDILCEYISGIGGSHMGLGYESITRTDSEGLRYRGWV